MIVENPSALRFLASIQDVRARETASQQFSALVVATEKWFNACSFCHTFTPTEIPIRRFGIDCLSFPQTLLQQLHLGVYFINGGVARPIVQIAVVEPLTSKFINHSKILQLAPKPPAFYWGRETFVPGLTSGMLTIRNQDSTPDDRPVSPVTLDAFYHRLEGLGFF